MKTSGNHRPNTARLARYLGGEMSQAEANAFEDELSRSGEDLKSMEKMKKQWWAMEGYDEGRSPDTLKAWNRLYERLRDEQLIPVKAEPVKVWYEYNLVRVAAVMLILVAIGSAIYFSMNRRQPAELVRLDTGQEAGTLVKTLTDGSVIYIARNSYFSFPKEFEADSRNVGLKGEAFFDIARDPAKPFVVETEEALIEVLGTAFNVRTQNGNGFELFVDRGKVKVTLKKDPAQSELVEAGEQVSAVSNGLVKSKHLADPESAWYRERMNFKDESLKNIISVLNRNYNTNFVLADEEVGRHKLTVTFQDESPATMTELICLTLNLKSETINGSVVLSEYTEGARHN